MASPESSRIAQLPRIVSLVVAMCMLSRADVLIDEDFTDGALDGVNAGADAANWHGFGGGDVGFKAPNSRSGFTTALARRSAGGGSSWAGMQWKVRDDTSADGLREFSIEKGTQVLYVEFRCFSDAARASTEYYGIEVAMLEQVTDAEYQGHPHYGHDLSFEVKQAFSTRGSDYQLEANVENDSHRDVECVRSAHYSGGTTSDDLDQVYRNLIVFDPHADSTIDR